MRLATADEASGAISESKASQAVVDAGYPYASKTLYLVVSTTGVGEDILNPEQPHLVWLARWTDLPDMGVGPPAVLGTAAAPSLVPLTYGYVLIDAKTGAFVNATFMEAP